MSRQREAASLDAKQKMLAKRLIKFRHDLLESVENKKPDRQLLQNMKGMDTALKLLRNVSKKLRKYDYRTFTDVINAIKMLQGDLSNKV